MLSPFANRKTKAAAAEEAGEPSDLNDEEILKKTPQKRKYAKTTVALWWNPLPHYFKVIQCRGQALS